MDSEPLAIESTETPRSLRAEVFLFTFIRTVINSSYRLVYPLLPLFATGMGVSLDQMGLAFSIRSVLGVVSPFIATLADTHGRKRSMVMGLVLFFFGSLITVLMPNFLGFVLGSSLVVIANGVFIPSMQSYLSDQIPYSKRGFYIAVTELSWSLAFIIGVPLLGLLVHRYQWHTPSIALSILALILLIALWFMIPSDKPHTSADADLASNLKLVLGNTAVLFALLVPLLFTGANEVVNLVFGTWIKDSFGLAFESLTVASVLIGSSELASEFLSAIFLDKFGKTRTILAGLILNILVVLILPFTKVSFWAALLFLGAYYISFEFALIAYLTFMSEFMPKARATVMAVTVATFSLGRVIGSAIGPALYREGFWLICLSAALLNLAAIILFRIRKLDKAGSQAA